MIGARSVNGEGRGPNMQAGTLGKDYVAGEVNDAHRALCSSSHNNLALPALIPRKRVSTHR